MAAQTMVTRRPGGWPDPNRPNGLKLCNTQNTARCQAPAEYRIQTRGRGYTATGYYCATHLPT